MNAKIASERTTAARSRARQRPASRHEPTCKRTGVAFIRCNGGLGSSRLRKQARSQNSEMVRHSWFHVLEVVQVVASSVLSQIVGKVFTPRKL